MRIGWGVQGVEDMTPTRIKWKRTWKLGWHMGIRELGIEGLYLLAGQGDVASGLIMKLKLELHIGSGLGFKLGI